MRCFRKFSQNKLPKRAFRAMLPTIFTERASKTSVSRDASDSFHRKNFQNDRFVRGFLQISQNKLPKRAFRARLPSNFREKASKMIVSCEASWLPPNFTEQCFQNERFARCFRQFLPKMRVSLQFRAIDTPNPTRGFIRQNQNVRLATTARHPKFQNVYVSLQRRPQKCMNPSTVNRTRFAHTKM